MTAAITVVPTTPVATKDVVIASITGAPENDTSAYDNDLYPSEPEIRYYVEFEVGGVEKLRTVVFSTRADGTAEVPGVIIPSTGSWTARLKNAGTGSTVASSSAFTAS